MANPSPAEIEKFLREQYQLWNDRDRDGIFACFRKIAPNGFTVEYVGGSFQDGERAMNEMFEVYGGKVRTDVLQLLVNGNEAATYIDNVELKPNGRHIPSLETYLFKDGKLHVRYFHPSESAPGGHDGY
jgi:hypothetical protein